MTTTTSSTGKQQGRTVRLILVAFLALAAVAGLYLIAVTPPTPESIYPKCMFHKVTGLHCPGCGMGRATHFLLNGRPLTAIQYNAFVILVLPVVVVAAIRSLFGWALRAPTRDHRPIRAFWIWLLFAALLLFAIARNLPFEPFTRLAPQELPSATADAQP